MKRLEPNEVREARAALGMTQKELAAALLLTSTNSADTVRAWEAGRRLIPGPESVAIQLMVKLGLKAKPGKG